MADTSVYNLTASGAIADGDLLPIVDISDTTQSANGSTRKITKANLTTDLAPKASPTFTGTVTMPVGLTGIAKLASGVVSAVTAPSGAIVGDTDSQVLSGKTLTKPIINGSIGAYTTDTDGATITFDLSASNVHTVVLAGNRTLAISNASVGQIFVLRLVQDGTGTRTVTWFTTIKWAGGSAPTLTTTINKADTFIFICTSASNYDGYIVGQNI